MVERMASGRNLPDTVENSTQRVEVPGLKSKPEVETMEASATPAYEVKSLNGYETIQLFNRYKMGLLWNNKRDCFDPGQVKLLKSLWDNKQKGTLKCKTPITYKFKAGREGELGYGRYYGSLGSLEQIERDIRATLCADLYWDIDIANCHPVLAVQLAKREFNMEMPMLQYYIANRKSCYTKFMTDYGLSEADAKNVMLSLLNGGGLNETTTVNGKNEFIYSEE